MKRIPTRVKNMGIIIELNQCVEPVINVAETKLHSERATETNEKKNATRAKANEENEL